MSATYRRQRLRSRVGRRLISSAIALSLVWILPQEPAEAFPLEYGTGTDISTTSDGLRWSAVGDLDGDGDQDIATASFLNDTIAWHENASGDGTTWTSTDITTAADGAQYVSIGDLDGDGDLDLASASSNNNTIAWYENTNGDASAWAATDIVTDAEGAHSVAISDLDGDGDMDLAAANFVETGLAWYENTNGDASAWTEANVPSGQAGAREVVAGDIDSDGDVDLAAAWTNFNTIRWFENDNGDGSSWTATDVTTTADSVRGLTLGDIEGNGALDIVGANGESPINVYFNGVGGDGSSWVQRFVSSAPDTPEAVSVADLDVDGDLDIASTGLIDDSVTTYENQGNNNWVSADVTTGANAPYSVQPGDFDGDGDLDLVSAASTTVKWYENELPARTSPSWAAPVPATSSADNAESVALDDIDGDGDLDMASASANDDTIAWYENDAGDGSSWTADDVATNAEAAASVGAGDIDGDGDVDLASASGTDDTIAWYENDVGDGSAWTPDEVDTNADDAASVAVGDIDGDGDMDLASASENDDTIAWYENDAGDGSGWTPDDVDTGADGARSVAIADLDGDGDLDLASASTTDSTVAWYENDAGDGSSWTPTNITTDALLPTSVTAADIDGDGDVDLAASSAADDMIRWLENTAGDASAWTPDVVATDVELALSVRAGDLDGDGDLDLASASMNDSTIAWYENVIGDGSDWQPADVSITAAGPRSVAIGDIDTDGDLDLASATRNDDTVAWYEALPTLSVGDATADEGHPLSVEITAGRIHEDVTIEVTTVDGTATAAEDFAAKTAELVTLTAGTTSQTLEIATTDDNVDEPTESFTATFESPVGADIPEDDDTSDLTITDDVPRLTIDNVEVSEKNVSIVKAKFTLTLSAPSPVDVSVEAVTTEDSAEEGDDYVGKEKTVTIAAGETTETLTVKVKGDKTDEQEEKFFVDLSSPVDVDLDDDRGKGTIEDNDDKPKLSVTDVEKAEGNSGEKDFVFKVKLNRESGKTVEVHLETDEDTAKSPSDFVAKTKDLTFKPGVTKKEVVIQVKGDKDDEGKEKFFLKLSKGEKAKIDDTKGSGVIRNDD